MITAKGSGWHGLEKAAWSAYDLPVPDGDEPRAIRPGEVPIV